VRRIVNLQTRITELLNIRYPILQGGMAWITGWEMASAVSNAGGLGTIASATMEPDELVRNITKTREHTKKPFAVNIPLRLPSSQRAAEIAIAEQVPVVVSSAGSPGKYTEKMKKRGITVLQVAFTLNMVKRCNEAGVEGIIAMGAEGGGNISPSEISTFVLVREAVEETDLPVVAAGGIADARGLVAALSLGAEGVQIGTRILATHEATLHDDYKQAILRAKDTDTLVTGRSTGLQFRILKNMLATRIQHMEREGKKREEIDSLTIGSLRKAAVQGDLQWGSVMLGQVAGMIHEIQPIKKVLDDMVSGSMVEIERLTKHMTNS
jgi:enoyl-[acyl-carrier protein] reductase II